MIHENPSPQRARWIEKMALFNFTIHYQPGVKMGYADFVSRMDTFLPKNNISILTNTLRVQKQPEFLPLKRTRILIIKLIVLTTNKWQKSNPIVPPKKVEYIRRKKTHNGYYCQ